MERNAASQLEVSYCNGIVPTSGAVGTGEVWAKVFKAASRAIHPLTAIINYELDPSFGAVNFTYQTDVKIRWSDDKGGGEAILDAASGLIVTVGGGWIEIEVNHKGVTAIGGTPGANAIFSITGFVGTVPHPRPVRSQRILALAAGALSARARVPRYTYLSRLEGVPEITPQCVLRGFQTAALAGGAIQEVSGRNPLVNMSGIDFVSVENQSPLARDILVVHELSL